jgi:hypothetical protein
MSAADPLFATRWVHAYERDSAAGAVFVPDGPAVPLSRRPREQVVFHEDGRAEWFTGTDDDRLAAAPARWHEAGAAAAEPTAAAPILITLVERHDTRLVLRVEHHGKA